MVGRRRMVAAALCLGLASSTGPVLAQDADDAPFFLGVQTHFVQGWRLEFLDLLPRLGAISLRDELSWPQIEQVAGRYFYNSSRAAYLNRAIGMGIDPLILFTDTHPLYDDGQTPYSPEAQAALAAYVAATIGAYSPALRRIEIGNEFNSADFVTGPFTTDRPRYFASTLRAVHDAVKADHPETEILCTGTHSVAIGFFRALFENGILNYCDAISVHLYRDKPEVIEAELGRLTALMEEFGRVLPIYVTEFGEWFDDPEDAPDFMLKMVAQMGAAGVAGAWWYALLDQPWWPNMGLYLPEPAEPMPAADSFRLLQERLLPLGRPRRIGTNPADQIFAFGEPARALIAWGAQAQLELQGATEFLDARGRAISPVTALGDTPVVILGDDLEFRVRRDHTITDVHYGFGQSPWSYYSERPDGSINPLEHIDWEWSSFLGDPWLRPLLVSHGWISGAMFDTGPHYAIERFTAQQAGNHRVSARWFTPDDTDDAGAHIRVLHNGAVVAEGHVSPYPFELGSLILRLDEGDQLDFVVGPSPTEATHAVRRDIEIRGPCHDG